MGEFPSERKLHRENGDAREQDIRCFHRVLQDIGAK